jgi:ribosomal protein S18 acetylase RimI-like enzyme
MNLQETPPIRSAGPGDIAALVAVHRESAAFHQGLDAQLYRISDARAVAEMFAQARTSSETAIIVAEVDGQIVGYSHVRLLPPAGASSMLQPHVGAEVGLAVQKPLQRRGLGHALGQAAHTWAVAHGAQVMQLDCHAANEAAIHLYEKLGYQIRGHVMTKRLP